MYELKCTECGIEGYSDEASSIVCQPCHKKTEALAASRLELAKVVDRHRKDRMHSDMKLAWEMAQTILAQAKELGNAAPTVER